MEFFVGLIAFIGLFVLPPVFIYLIGWMFWLFGLKKVAINWFASSGLFLSRLPSLCKFDDCGCCRNWTCPAFHVGRDAG